ncbi:MAG: ABC-2 transporter permease [Proteobacteria bacterium]|nr:ABC-2 transporter permease [Pseudomonadota bacterium]
MNTTATAPAPAAGVQPPLTLRSTLTTLVRREFWEHPGLWRAPLIIAALLVGTIVIGAIPAGHHVDIHMDNWDGVMSEERRAQAFAVSQVAPLAPLYLIMALVLSFYLLDSLYAERRDRSILFWKSLPVSDGLTVLSKFLVALVVVPVGVLVLGTVCHLLLFLAWQVGVATAGFPPVLTWHTGLWFRVEGLMIGSLVLGMLWYAPMAAALLLVSAWVRKNPVAWATLAPIVAIAVEWKFGTHYLARLLYYRTFGIWAVLGTGHGERLEHGVRLDAVLGDISFGRAFANIDLWLGVLVAVALLYATVRIRRYRDDTAG